ncbi:hypothetical protein VNI00_009066 [Paramarasmius palmivorus]|uniref:PHD-type domain-containing protein n=1 Tax=Paramarasmius palmivorus TaxID=297713 RepID=A0AAW0CP45_9AGAR
MAPLDTPSTPRKSPNVQEKHDPQSSSAPTQRYTLLPTPQSPNATGPRSQTPDSPTPLLHRQTLTRPPLPSVSSLTNAEIVREHLPAQLAPRSQQIMTPDSSPYTVKDDRTPKQPPTNNFNAALLRATPNSASPPDPRALATPKQSTSVDPITAKPSSNTISTSLPSASTQSPLQTSIGIPLSNSQSQPHAEGSSRTEVSQNTLMAASQTPTPTASQLSSPFMDKVALPLASATTPVKGQGPMLVDDVFSAGLGSQKGKGRMAAPAPIPSTSTSQLRHIAALPSMPQVTSAGGELDRIRERRMAEQAAIEARRPDFFVREDRSGKRKSTPPPPAIPSADSERDRSLLHDGAGGIGIMDSPTKGRRIKLFSDKPFASSYASSSSFHSPHKEIKLFPDLKLFQETSEESFEESLMAGGYGRYRTAEWVRAPQPIPIEVLQAQARGLYNGQQFNAINSASTPGSAVVKGLEDQTGDGTQTQQRDGSSAAESTPVPQTPQPLTEKEVKKRKRLDAFRVLTTSSNLSAHVPNSDDAFVNNVKSGKANGKSSNSSKAKITNTGPEPTRKLYPVELEGRGRVLVDMLPGDGSDLPPEGGMAGSGKKKKREKKDNRGISPNDLLQYPYGQVLSTAAKKKAQQLPPVPIPSDAEKPDWPDAEFPWRLREEEREEIRKREEEERLRWVERFLEEDDEDDEGPSPVAIGFEDQEDEEDDVIPSSQVGVVYDDAGFGLEKPVAYRPGRGKMVRLNADPPPPTPTEQGSDSEEDKPLASTSGVRMIRPPPPVPPRRHSVYFPSDPADAKAALLSKRSVRSLTFKKQMAAERELEKARLRQFPNVRRVQRREQLADEQTDDETEEDVPCICGGAGANFEDDQLRELVQCDSCNAWYHLGCLGVSEEDLGGEDDPWFCFKCDPQRQRGREPMFVPTDETPVKKRKLDGGEEDDDPMLYSRTPPESPDTTSKHLPIPSTPGSTSPLKGTISTAIMTPKTPTRKRVSRVGDSDYGFSSASKAEPYFQSGSSSSTLLTSSSSRGYPITPRHTRGSRTEPRIAQNHHTLLEAYEESPLFDPTSTPSRGFKFNAPFTTPTRKPGGQGKFYTPSRRPNGGSVSSISGGFGGPGFLSSALDDNKSGVDWYLYGGDESPIRRKKSSITEISFKPRRTMDDLAASAQSRPSGEAGLLDEGFEIK